MTNVNVLSYYFSHFNGSVHVPEEAAFFADEVQTTSQLQIFLFLLWTLNRENSEGFSSAADIPLQDRKSSSESCLTPL